ncbi:MAG: hypothetical protein ACRDK2_12270 [Solirubrobacteraceae bacterium]
MIASSPRTPDPPAWHAAPAAPRTPSEWRGWLIALTSFAVSSAALVLILTGVIGSSRQTYTAPPPVLLITPTPVAGPTEQADFERMRQAAVKVRTAIVTKPSVLQQRLDRRSYSDQTGVHIPRIWMGGFYPIYAEAQHVFGVNWLLISSIHRQESAFSTAPSTYHGLNFASCCGGPMQFNVTNGGAGIPSTWDLVANSFTYGKRPAAYDHHTATHPSIYDDFDSIMAAAHLLSADGAGFALDGSAWNAAYDYYGHDATGVTYADQVLARAIGWSQHGFCINCGIENGLLEAVHAAYGAPVLAALAATPVNATAASTKPTKRTR